MALNIFSQSKSETAPKQDLSRSQEQIEGSLNGRKEALQSSRTDLNINSKIRENISDFLLDQKNQRNLSNDQIKLYHQVLSSKEFQESLNSVDSKGQTLAHSLSKLMSSNLDRGLVNAFDKSESALKTEILTNILDKIQTHGFTNQGTKNTCVIAAVESQAFNDNPAEVSRMVIELATKGQYEIQRGNEKLKFTLPTEHLGHDEPHPRFVARNVFEQVFQESSSIALLKSMGGAVESYDSRTTGCSIPNTSGEFIDLKGKFAVEGELLYSMLTGHGHEVLSRQTNPTRLQNATLEALEKLQAGNRLSYNPAEKTLTGCDFTEGIIVHLRWAPDGSEHAKHCLKALGIHTNERGEKFVILGNSHYEQGFKPNSVFEINRGSPPHQRLEMMPLADFQSRLEEAHIADGSRPVSIAETKQLVRNALDNCQNGGYYIHAGSIMLTVPVNHQTKSATEMSNVNYRTPGEIGTEKHRVASIQQLDTEAEKVAQIKIQGLSLQEQHLLVKNSRNKTEAWQSELREGESVTRFKNYVLFGHTFDDSGFLGLYSKQPKNWNS